MKRLSLLLPLLSLAPLLTARAEDPATNAVPAEPAAESGARGRLPLSAKETIRALLVKETASERDGRTVWGPDVVRQLREAIGEPVSNDRPSSLYIREWVFEDGSMFFCYGDEKECFEPAFVEPYPGGRESCPHWVLKEREESTEDGTRPVIMTWVPEKGSDNPLPLSNTDYYFLCRVYDISSDRLFYKLSGDCNHRRNLDAVIASGPDYDSLADLLEFFAEHAEEESALMFWEHLSPDSNRYFQVSNRFVQVVSQPEWNELRKARKDGTLEQFANERRKGRPKDPREYLLDLEKEELAAFWANPPAPLSPACRKLFEAFIRQDYKNGAIKFVPSSENEGDESDPATNAPALHAESAEGAKEPAP